MLIIVDSLEKHESINGGETVKDTSEMLTVTIALAEYRSLVASTQKLQCENEVLRREADQAYQEKEKIMQQWENQKKWYESQLVKEKEPAERSITAISKKI